MTRLPTALLALVVVLVAVAVPFAAAASGVAETADGQPALPAPTNESDNGTSPGATLNGALGSEAAAIDGEFERRSFDHAVRTAPSADARAAVVAARLATVEERLAALEAREERLTAARENGTLTHAEYRSRMTVLAATARSLGRLGDRTAVYAETLPPGALVERGVTPERVAELRARAGNLSAFDRDLFEGEYGNRTLPGGGLDEPFPDGTPGDDWRNDTTWNGTDGFEWNGTDGFEWNGTDGIDWNGTAWNGTAWNGTAWNGTAWNGTDWNGTDWNGTDWNGTGWDDAEWNETDWNTTAP